MQSTLIARCPVLISNPVEGRKLSSTEWLVIYQDGVTWIDVWNNFVDVTKAETPYILKAVHTGSICCGFAEQGVKSFGVAKWPQVVQQIHSKSNKWTLSIMQQIEDEWNAHRILFWKSWTSLMLCYDKHGSIAIKLFKAFTFASKIDLLSKSVFNLVFVARLPSSYHWTKATKHNLMPQQQRQWSLETSRPTSDKWEIINV